MLFCVAPPVSSADFRTGWPSQENASVQCDRALAAAQDIETGVGKGIVATVEGVPITDYEMKQRIAWHVAVARDEDPIARFRTRTRILTSLRREILDRIAAAHSGVIVSSPEVDAELDEFLSAQGLTRHGLQAGLERAGVQVNTVRAIIAARLLRARLTRTPPERLQVAPFNCLGLS
jgi:hypothetical protein